MNPVILKYAKWQNILILLGLIIIINVLLALSLSSNPKLKPLDLEFFYDNEKAYELLSAYNEQERSVYLLIELTLDIIYPIIYSLCLSFALYLLFSKLTLAKLPLYLVFLELVENLGIVVLLVNYPIQHPWIANLTGIFTTAKWFLALTCLAIVLYGGFTRLIRKNT